MGTVGGAIGCTLRRENNCYKIGERSAMKSTGTKLYRSCRLKEEVK